MRATLVKAEERKRGRSFDSDKGNKSRSSAMHCPGFVPGYSAGMENRLGIMTLGILGDYDLGFQDRAVAATKHCDKPSSAQDLSDGWSDLKVAIVFLSYTFDNRWSALL